jgi:hypothetical protein
MAGGKKKESPFVKIKQDASEAVSRSRMSNAVQELKNALADNAGLGSVLATDAALDACQGLELADDVARDLFQFTAALEKHIVELADSSAHVTPGFTDTIKQYKALYTKAVGFPAVKATL